ncbi:MAG: type II secretion system F family protein [Alphaproteobacteria bacterium]|nr:type II secretion system F family protein [Alphaproteobacteria bacterium]
MTQFSYRAITAGGAFEEGRLVADSKDAAILRLRAEGKTPVAVRAALTLPSLVARSGKLSEAVWLDIVRPLSLLLRSGMPLAAALRMTIRLTRRRAAKALAGRLLARVEDGRALAAAIEAEPEPPTYLPALTRAGEHSGRLAFVFERLAARMKMGLSTRRQITSALTYPAFLAGVAVAALSVLLGVVVPRFEVLFRSYGEKLPLQTRIVMDLSHFVVANGGVMLLLLLLAALAVRAYGARPDGRAVLARLQLALPVAGELFVQATFATFARTLGGLLEAGVPLASALPVARRTISNVELLKEVDAASQRAQGGEGLCLALERETRFPPIAVRVALVGEEAGELARGLIDAADMTSEELDHALKRGMALLEPALILTMGLIVAGIVVSLYTGILSVNSLAFE